MLFFNLISFINASICQISDFLSNCHAGIFHSTLSKIVSEYDQEIPQSQIADKPMAPRGRATQQSRDTRKTN